MRERSFTLFEVVISVAIMSTMLVELVGFQGNVIYFSEYGMNVSRATYLAKRVMSRVEHLWQTKPGTEIETETNQEVPFEDFPEFSYKLNIKVWPIPFADLLSGGDGKKPDDASGEETAKKVAQDVSSMTPMIEQYVGKTPLKVAHVEVSWAEGAKRNSVSLALLLPDIKKLEEALPQLKGAYDDLAKAERGGGAETDKSKMPGTQAGPNTQTQPGGTVDDGSAPPMIDQGGGE